MSFISSSYILGPKSPAGLREQGEAGIIHDPSGSFKGRGRGPSIRYDFTDILCELLHLPIKTCSWMELKAVFTLKMSFLIQGLWDRKSSIENPGLGLTADMATQ